MKPRVKSLREIVTPKIIWCRELLEAELRLGEVAPEDHDKISQVIKKLREIGDDLSGTD